MPLELSLWGLTLPTLLPLFLLAALSHRLLDSMLSHLGLYRWLWHPSLFRIALFVVIFAGLGLAMLADHGLA